MAVQCSAVSRFMLTLVAMIIAPIALLSPSAAVATAQATPDVESDSPQFLFAGTFGSEYLPDNPVWVDVYRMEWDPGAEWHYTESYRSLRLWCVEAGSFVITADAPVTVMRRANAQNAGTPKVESSPSEVELGPGDCAVTPTEGPFEMRNPGSKLAVIVLAMVVPANVDVPAGYPFGQVREVEPFGSSMFSFELAQGSFTLVLEKVTIDRGASRQEAMDRFAAAPDEAVRVVRVDSRPDPPIALAVTVRPSTAPDGTPAARLSWSPR